MKYLGFSVIRSLWLLCLPGVCYDSEKLTQVEVLCKIMLSKIYH